MDQKSEGRLLALVEQIHDDMTEVKASIVEMRESVAKVRTEQAVQRVWIRIIVAAVGGGGCVAGAAAAVLRAVGGQ